METPRCLANTMSFELYDSAITLVPLQDDNGNNLATGTKVTIVHFLGDTHCIYEVAWPDPTLVGGHDFSTGSTELKNLKQKK